MLPKLEASVMEPFWKNTRSSGAFELDGLHQQLIAALGQLDVGYGAAGLDAHALLHQPRLQWAHQGIVLVVHGALDAGQRLDARELLHEAVQVALEFHCAVPWLEGERGGPHVPEWRVEEGRRQVVRDRAVAQRRFVRFVQLEQFHPVAQAEAHRAHVHLVAVAVHQARARMRLVQLVEGQRFIQHRLAGMDQRRDRGEQVPGAFVVIGGQHAAAAQAVAIPGVARAIKAAAGHAQRFENADAVPAQVSVADHEGRRRQVADAGAGHVYLFFLSHLITPCLVRE
jgi:hypothetical protein